MIDTPDYGLPPEVKAGLDREFGRIERHCTELKTRGRADLVGCDDAPDVFHYTSVKAAASIIESSSLWATHARSFIVDPTEFRYGIELGHRALERAAGKKPEVRSAFLESAAELLELCIKDDWADPYVVSFCPDDGNRDIQWKEYGKEGRGVSIAFGWRDLSHHFGDFARILPVTYEPDLQDGILEDQIEACSKLHERWAQGQDQNAISRYCKCNLVLILLIEAFAFKQQGYERERECRLICSPICSPTATCPSPEIRPGESGPIRYIKLQSPTRRLPIRKLMKGPEADRSSIEELERLLAERGYPAFEDL